MITLGTAKPKSPVTIAPLLQDHDLDEQCIANLQAVYQFAVNQLKFEWRKIILYG